MLAASWNGEEEEVIMEKQKQQLEINVLCLLEGQNCFD